MINIQELRIGNWVKHNDIISSSQYPDDIFQWSSAHWYDIERAHLSLASIEPIPLTPEILEICGFTEIDGNDFYRFFEFGDIRVHVGKNVFVSVFGAKLDHTIGVFHLHQLQNLFYALTNTELNYQPE